MRDLPTFDLRQITQIIQQSYGIKIEKIKPYRSVFCCQTQTGKKLFKPFYESEERLNLIIQAKEHLFKQGFHHFIPFLETTYGHLYCREGEQLYYLTDWVDGHLCNYANPFELKKATQVFAQFHHAAKNFLPISKIPSHLNKWPVIFLERIKDLYQCRQYASNSPKTDSFATSFLKIIDFYIQQAEKAYTLLCQSSYLEICQQAINQLPFCHHDLAHHNVIITTNNQPVLIDFDYLLQDLHLHDLASVIIRNGKASEWNLKRCHFILKNYQQIKPVTVEELEVMLAFMTFPYDIWFLAYQRFIAQKTWPEDYYKKELDRKTKYKKYRQNFLKDFLQKNERTPTAPRSQFL